MKEPVTDPSLTKVEDVRRKIRHMALEQGPDTQLPPVRELCDIFSTSRITLREALAPLLSDQTLYSKEREGIFVSPYIHYKSVAVLFDASIFALRGISPFWTYLWVKLFQEAERRSRFKTQKYAFHNIMPNLDVTHSLPEPIIQALTARPIHGVLAIGLSSPVRDWLIEQSIAYVSFAGGGPWVVELDFDALGYMAAKTLLEQGCTRIGLWQPTTQRLAHEVIQHSPAFVGVQRAHHEAHLAFSSRFSEILPLPLAQPQHVLPFQEQGYLLARQYFSIPDAEKPDGLILGEEMLAHGALAALQESGVRIGQDIKIVAHSNVDSPMLFGQKQLTIFEFDSTELIQTLFSLLDALLLGEDLSDPVTYIAPRKRS